VYVADLWGVFESALSLARRLNNREVKLNVDSMAVIQDVVTNKSYSFFLVCKRAKDHKEKKN
jgi:hypothetical protein